MCVAIRMKQKKEEPPGCEPQKVSKEQLLKLDMNLNLGVDTDTISTFNV